MKRIDAADRVGEAVGDALWKNPEVRHEAPLHPGGDERTPPLARRSGSVKLRAA